MIAYALDANALITIITGRSATLARRVLQTPKEALAIPAVVAHELVYGAFRSQRVQYNLETLRSAFSDFAVLDFDATDAHAAGEIRAVLARNGTPIGPYDVLIAGQAKARGLTVITNNVREFARVPDLKVEDWTV